LEFFHGPVTSAPQNGANLALFVYHILLTDCLSMSWSLDW